MSKSILTTLAYFSIFDYPLTIIELWQWLYWQEAGEPDFNVYQDSILELKQKKLIIVHQGFVCLVDKESDVIKRQQNYRDSFAKYEIARKICRVFAFLPFVQAIFVCNSLAYNNSRSDGDIDLFIVTKKDRLWLSRFLTIGLLKIFKLRPVKNDKKNKIDPTFFINDKDLNLNKIAIENDIYLKYWLGQLVPIYDPNNVLLELREGNVDLLKFLPNALPVQPHARRLVKYNWIIGLVRFKWKLLFDYQCFEDWSRIFQLRIMPVILKNQLNKNKGVVANMQMIKMHSNDRRQEYADKWQGVTNYLFKKYDSQSS